MKAYLQALDIALRCHDYNQAGYICSYMGDLYHFDGDYLLGKDKYKKASLIYEMVENIRATLFRQAMFAEFEKIVHEKIESGTMLSAEDLNEIYLDLNKKYFGENVEVDDKIKYEWARIPHFYSCFYVYKYAAGISSAIAIASKILRDVKTRKNKEVCRIIKNG